MNIWLPVVLFAISTSITPGPNNIMLMSSGLNFGLKRTLAHLFGIELGFPIMLLIVGLFLGSLFVKYPLMHHIIKYAGAAYLLYLSWKIANSTVDPDSKKTAKPMNFFQAMLFQWVNPKAWIMIVGALATYTTVSGNMLHEILLIALLFFICGVPSGLMWIFFGKALSRIMKNKTHQRYFNYSMGLLLFVSVILIFVE